MFPLEFRRKVNHEETRVMGYPPVKTAWSNLESFWHRASVRQTDRRTDRQTHTQNFIHQTDGRIYDS